MLSTILALQLSIGAIAPPPGVVAVNAPPPSAHALPWQSGSAPEFETLGAGIGIVFSPDLATPENRAFYERLGFTYFESARWTDVLREVKKHQSGDRTARLRYLLVESHGANGNGLKLQEGNKREQVRSYISLGALQEAADKLGIDTVLLSACNAGRLFRPEIYNVLNREPDDPMFLPPTGGVIDARRDFDPGRSETSLLRRKQSRLETLMEGKFSELPSWLRKELEANTGRRQGKFVISTMLIQLILADPSLQLTSTGYDLEKSRADLTPGQSEKLFKRFVAYLSASSPSSSLGSPASRR